LDDISRGLIKVDDKLAELRFLKDTGRKMEVKNGCVYLCSYYCLNVCAYL